LRVEHQPSAIDQVGEDAADQSKNETGRRGHERVEAEPEGRVRQLQHEPTLRNRLHPRADV